MNRHFTFWNNMLMRAVQEDNIDLKGKTYIDLWIDHCLSHYTNIPIIDNILAFNYTVNFYSRVGGFDLDKFETTNEYEVLEFLRKNPTKEKKLEFIDKIICQVA